MKFARSTSITMYSYLYDKNVFVSKVLELFGIMRVKYNIKIFRL